MANRVNMWCDEPETFCYGQVPALRVSCSMPSISIRLNTMDTTGTRVTRIRVWTRKAGRRTRSLKTRHTRPRRRSDETGWEQSSEFWGDRVHATSCQPPSVAELRPVPGGCTRPLGRGSVQRTSAGTYYRGQSPGNDNDRSGDSLSCSSGCLSWGRRSYLGSYLRQSGL